MKCTWFNSLGQGWKSHSCFQSLVWFSLKAIKFCFHFWNIKLKRKNMFLYVCRCMFCVLKQACKYLRYTSPDTLSTKTAKDPGFIIFFFYLYLFVFSFFFMANVNHDTHSNTWKTKCKALQITSQMIYIKYCVLREYIHGPLEWMRYIEGGLPKGDDE